MPVATVLRLPPICVPASLPPETPSLSVSGSELPKVLPPELSALPICHWPLVVQPCARPLVKFSNSMYVPNVWVQLPVAGSQVP